MKDQKRKSLFEYFRIFRGYIGNRFFLFLAVVFLAGFSSSVGFSMFIPLFNYTTVNAVPDNVLSRIVYRGLTLSGIGVSLGSLCGLIILVFFAKAFFEFLSSVFFSRINTGLVSRLRLKIIEKYRNVLYSYFVGTRLGTINNILSVEVERISGSLNKFVTLLTCVTNSAIYFSFSFLFNWRLSLLALAAAALVYAVFNGFVKKVARLSLLVTEKSGEMQNLFIQIGNNFKYLKATSGFFRIIGHLAGAIRKNRAYSMKTGIFNAITVSSTEPIAVIIVVFVILYFVGVQKQPIAMVLIPMFFLYKTLGEVLTFQRHRQIFYSTVGSVLVAEEAMADLDRHQEDQAGKEIHGFRSVLELKDVSLKLGAHLILKNISMRIRHNSIIGVVGESGSGKTTLVDVLSGLLPPLSGSIRIDGTDYRDINKEKLRSLFGYITQEPVIFNDTIANNISLWAHADRGAEGQRDLERAARIAHALEFIEKTENGFETFVGDKGIRLSGGQRQRIAIAREVFKNCQVLFFDEATSSLDSESENYIQQSITGMIGQKTLVIVAHRLATVRHCHRIYVMRRGHIVEQGSWSGLMKKKGSLFMKMCRMQGIRK